LFPYHNLKQALPKNKPGGYYQEIDGEAAFFLKVYDKKGHRQGNG